MTASFCASPMPAHRISSGMKALGRQVAREADEGLEEGLDRLVGAHRHAERQRQHRGDDEAAEHPPHRHADVLGEALSVSSVQPERTM